MAGIGPRFLVPSASNLSNKFLEMRRIGTYPSDVLLACLFSFIEFKTDRTQEFALSLCQALFGTPAQRLDPVQDLIKSLDPSFRSNPLSYEDPSLCSSLREVSRALKARFGFGLENADQIRSCVIKLGEALGCCFHYFEASGGLQNIDLSCRLTPGNYEKGTIEFTFAVSQTNIYLFYTSLGDDSFIDLPCGHIMLKHQAYELIYSLCAPYATSLAEIQEMTILCPCCQTPIQSTIAGMRPFTSRSISSKSRGRQSLCTSHGKPGERIQCRNCSLSMCNECALFRALTIHGPLCPACREVYADGISFEGNFRNYQWIEKYAKVALRDIRNVAGKGVREGDPGVNSQGGNPFRRSKVEDSKREFELQQILPVGSPPSSPKAKNANHCECGLVIENPVCKKKCLCRICLIQDYYYDPTAKPVCRRCNENISAFFNRKVQCNGVCKQVFSRKEIFYACGKCGVCICFPCAKKNPGNVVVCLTTEKAHGLSEKKIQLLQLTNRSNTH